MYRLPVMPAEHERLIDTRTWVPTGTMAKNCAMSSGYRRMQPWLERSPTPAGLIGAMDQVTRPLQVERVLAQRVVRPGPITGSRSSPFS